MRIGEATIMRPENFNFEQSFVEVTGTLDKTKGYRNAKKGPTKTAKGTRRVDLTPRCVNLVKRVIDENRATMLDNDRYQDNGFIFVTKNGIPIQSNSFNTALKKAGERVGIGYKSLSSHIFRHSHCFLTCGETRPKTGYYGPCGPF